MSKTILFILAILLSGNVFSKVLLPENESRSLDDAMSVVEKSKKDRKEFDDNKSTREMASERDPQFQKAFDELMKDLDQN